MRYQYLHRYPYIPYTARPQSGHQSSWRWRLIIIGAIVIGVILYISISWKQPIRHHLPNEQEIWDEGEIPYTLEVFEMFGLRPPQHRQQPLQQQNYTSAKMGQQHQRKEYQQQYEQQQRPREQRSREQRPRQQYEQQQPWQQRPVQPDEEFISTRETRKRLSKRQKKNLLIKQQYRCAICRKRLHQWDCEIDHRIPLAADPNGKYSDVLNHESNCRALCRACHGYCTHQQRAAGLFNRRKLRRKR